MPIYNSSGGQYAAVTGKRRRVPYSAFIDSQIPSLYQARARQEQGDFANAQLDLESQAIDEDRRSSDASIDESIRVSGIKAGLERDRLEQEAQQAKIGTAISGAQTLGAGIYGGSKLGLFGGGTAAAAGTAAQLAPGTTAAGFTGVTGTGTGTAAASGSGFGAIGTGLSYVAPAAVGFLGGKGGSAIAEGLFGQGELQSKGGGFLGGAAAGAAAGSFIPGIGTLVGGLIGGVSGLLSDTWLCTKTKEVVGMNEEEWSTISIFREYAKENFDNGLKWYIMIGPELIKSINGNAEFYEELKRNFLKPVIGLTRGGYPDIAFSVYKSVVIKLAGKWNPSLLETLPEEYRG